MGGEGLGKASLDKLLICCCYFFYPIHETNYTDLDVSPIALARYSVTVFARALIRFSGSAFHSCEVLAVPRVRRQVAR